MSSTLPSVPTAPGSFLSLIGANENKPLRDLVKPYLEYESKLRSLFAQDPSNPELADNLVGLVPIYDGHDDKITIRSRDVSSESQEEQDRYIMPLEEGERSSSGDRAIVDEETFRKNFNAFTEGTLENLNWSHIVAAGSSVMTPILPVPSHENEDEDTLRRYYHSKFAPVSDIDLFIYGTKDEHVAIKRMEAVEKTITKNLGRTSVLSIRTKNTVTIVSEYPHRHVQIVLRLYSSISEILTGFDVSCACVAYDGKQVYANPRAIVSWMLQCNDIDITRRSPSYEHRLAKYRKRGFEIYYPALDRKIIDPTIYERNLRGSGMKGLAKLLVLERLPTENERDNYLEMRRRERGRPGRKKPRRERRVLRGDYKADGGEVPDWGVAPADSEESMYETIAIPYGPRFNAERIKKHLFQTDMFLNSEWNKRVQKRRGAYLHRHPAFFGSLKYIVKDCCGYCPEPDPNNQEEMQLRAKDDKYYIRGKMTFIKDDPGRQEIGSFNPITDEDWTEMAYLSINEVLCRAIVANDPEAVKAFISEGGDVNKRDYTGRTPLHLAVLASTIDIIQILLDGGARITPRLFDGRTALHIAAARGDAEICKLLLLKNQQNEKEKEERDAREAQKAAAANTEKPADKDVEMKDADSTKESDQAEAGSEGSSHGDGNDDKDDEDSPKGDTQHSKDDEDEDMSIISKEEGSVSARTGVSSYINVKLRKAAEDLELGSAEEEEAVQDDVLDINKTDWDYQLSPLHYAIIHGYQDIVTLLVSDFGADILLPVVTSYNHMGVPDAVLLPISLVFRISDPQARAPMLRTLLKLGASSSQTDMEGATGLMRVVQTGDIECVKVIFEEDSAAARAAAKWVHMEYRERASNVLIMAIYKGYEEIAKLLLDNGAQPEITPALYARACRANDQKRERYRYSGVQPAEMALELEMPDVFAKIIELGVDPSSYACMSIPEEILGNVGYLSEWSRRYLTLLDVIDNKVNGFKEALEKIRKSMEGPSEDKSDKDEKKPEKKPKKLVSIPEEYEEGSYEYWMAAKYVKDENAQRELYNARLAPPSPPKTESNEDPDKVEKKRSKIEALLNRYNELADMLVAKGGKRFKDLHPAIWDRVFNKPKPEPYTPSPYPTYPDATKKPEEDEFKITFVFHEERGKKLDPKLNDAYQELYKAIWNGDKETLKRYTTTNWEENMPPLLICVQNQLGYTPISIAVYRKHPKEFLDLILTITEAQYLRDNKNKKVIETEKIYQLSDDADFFVEEIDFTEVELTRKLGDDEEEVEERVSAWVDAANMLETYVPYVVGDIEKHSGTARLLIQAVLAGNTELAAYITSRLEKFSGPTLTPGTFNPDLSHDNIPSFMVKNEHIDMLRDFMEKYGLGAMFDGVDNFKYDDSDEEDSAESEASDAEDQDDEMEVTEPEKEEEKKPVKRPKEYPGLSIDGKRKKDWVNLMNPNWSGPPRLQYQFPPIALFAAYYGSRKVYEWLESNGPRDAIRKWQATLEQAKDSKKSYFVKVLQAADDEKIDQWMGVDHPLLMHAVIKNHTVAGDPDLSEEDTFKWYEENLKFYATRNPEHLEFKKNRKGFTPLLLAASALNKYALKALIDLGADPYAKTPEGNFNIVHVMLKNFINPYNYWYYSRQPPRGTWEDLKDCLAILPEDVKAWAFCHRATDNNIAYTPLAYALANLSSSNDARIFKVLLEHSHGADTRKRTTLGELPIHAAVKSSSVEIIQCILDASPLDVVLMEDTNGLTALELATVKWYTDTALRRESSIHYPWEGPPRHNSVVEISTTKSTHSTPTPEDEYNTKLRKSDWGIRSHDSTEVRKMKMLEVMLKTCMEGGVGMRNLVPLRDVNEMAERLANRKKSSSWYWGEGGNYDDIVNSW
ncbi:hypothetical protein TWF696_004564 [Orbilia brochopaga]|uniref:Ankyrin repeat protein n=1 Tax=Orbilia brochopaga TaxID=3140254 RepID=A0AAV9V9U9_9PEZI